MPHPKPVTTSSVSTIDMLGVVKSHPRPGSRPTDNDHSFPQVEARKDILREVLFVFEETGITRWLHGWHLVLRLSGVGD